MVVATKKLTFEVHFEEVLLVELSSIVSDHGRADALPGGADVRLERVERVSEGEHGVDDKLDLGVLLIVGQVRHPGREIKTCQGQIRWNTC